VRKNFHTPLLGAFPAQGGCLEPETGLSAPIPQLRPRRSLRYFRFNPLRVLIDEFSPCFIDQRKDAQKM
jgi:hypothetical protein